MARPIIHGLRRQSAIVSEYWVWRGIRARCFNPIHRSYSHYGGRGITICERWRKSFAAFYEDMKGRPSISHTLDRIETMGGYWCGHCLECLTLERPANCRWATKIQQSLNRINNNRLTFNGETHCASEWADRLGISRQTLNTRLGRGWSISEALTRPVRRHYA